MPLRLRTQLVTILTWASPVAVTLIVAWYGPLRADPLTRAPHPPSAAKPGATSARRSRESGVSAGGRATAAPASAYETDVQASIRIGPSPRCLRTIDGFGTTAPAKLGGEAWLARLYADDLRASVLRVDLTPHFQPPVSNYGYNSPGAHDSPPLPGPEGNNVRTYRDLADYRRSWSGRRAAIAVLTSDLQQDLLFFDYRAPDVKSYGELARTAARAARARGEPFKLVGSIWSPAPWLKQSSGQRIDGADPVMPKGGTPWPFIWMGNFAGGVLDTSDTPRSELDDGGGPTSALTQFARISAAYVLGFQRTFGVRLYALSIQNELNFETFYNSCSYPDARGYAAALRAVRREFERVPELAEIRLMGPEDLLGAEPYALWQYGQPPQIVHKNLQYLAALAADPEAAPALSLFAVHAYRSDGVNAAGDDARMWRYWLDGWRDPPAPGLPRDVRGVRAYGKPSWMTEMSGEPSTWLPASGDVLANSALGLALKIHGALTAGEESAWLYWQLSDGKPVGRETLTDASLRDRAPKYVAFKHFARFIRPGACAVPVEVERPRELSVSAYRQGGATTVVAIHSGAQPRRIEVQGLGAGPVTAFVSSADALWRPLTPTRAGANVRLELPPQSVLTMVESKR